MNSADLKTRLSELKKLTLAKHDHWIYEPNDFEIFLSSIILNIIKIIKIVSKTKMLNKIYSEVVLSFKNILEIIFDKKLNTKKNNNNTLELNKLEKKLDSHLEIYQNSLVENRNLKKEISNLHSKIEKYLTSDKNISSEIGHNSNTRVDFYQEENVRLGSELLETKKKFEILKNEIEKYENQRSNLISKINSVNDALNDTNVLTNVFTNDVKPKVSIVDYNKIETKKSLDLNEKVKNIFSNKK